MRGRYDLSADLFSFGIVLTAGYILWMIQRTMFGPPVDRFESIRDASATEMVPVLVLAAAILVVCIYPAVISDVFASGLEPILQAIQDPAQLALR